jgi:hypothetical protein
MFKKFSLNKLLVLFTALGFTFLFADTTIEHWDVFNDEIMAFIPVVFSFVGLVIGVITIIVWKDKTIRFFQIFLIVSFLVAGAGLYFHIEDEEDEINLTVEQREHEENEKDKPLMAPLAFGGIAIVGLLGTARKWEAEVINT